MPARRSGSTGIPVRPVAMWLAAVVRRISGMPDYQAYLDHMQQCHPEKSAPSEREYFNEYLRSRYGDGPARCC
jgi:uncharacterized short protein YbdD (DUF466 family)